jgi:cobalt-zinc-cadmium efflux system protein
MGHGHHHHHGHDHSHSFEEVRSGNKKGLLLALIITSSIMILEFVGGLITNSLALLSDSGHMLSDSASLFLSMVAIWFAARPATSVKTYGYYRFEILAALLNGVLLFIVSGIIFKEAYARIIEPPEVSSGPMMLIALVGLLANLLSAYTLLRKGDVKNNVNLRSAYLHVLSDALGSLGAIFAGIIMFYTSWYYADPIISILVAILILKGAWGVIVHSLNILMEGTPETICRDEVASNLKLLPGVHDIHDLHIWTITSGLNSLSCHIVIKDDADSQTVLQEAINLAHDMFHIEHTTFQIETSKITHSTQKTCQ